MSIHLHSYPLQRRCPCACIVPPRIFNNIILNAEKIRPRRGETPLVRAQRIARVRSNALANLALLHSFTSARIGLDESERVPRQVARTRRLQGLAGCVATLGGQPQRTIMTAQNKQRSSGPVVRGEGDEPVPNDPAVNEAYDYMGATYDFFWNVFARNSIDGSGMTLDGVVHYGQDYDNAFWDGNQMTYGDGDGEQFNRFTISVDVIGHEMTHGVTQNEAALIYWGEPGALNESISDVFGSLVKQYYNNQRADQADWLIGQGLFTSAVQGVAIRSLKAPGTAYNDPVLGKDEQPANMRDYQHTVQDNGGVHINSGIPNHAFYLAATAVGGYAWETVGNVWYQVLTQRGLGKMAKFTDFAQLTLNWAQELYPLGPEPQAIGNAWAQVGISL